MTGLDVVVTSARTGFDHGSAALGEEDADDARQPRGAALEAVAQQLQQVEQLRLLHEARRLQVVVQPAGATSRCARAAKHDTMLIYMQRWKH